MMAVDEGPDAGHECNNSYSNNNNNATPLTLSKQRKAAVSASGKKAVDAVDVAERKDDPDGDVANEVGNMGQHYRISRSTSTEQEIEMYRQKQWRLNYQEAAIYLQEGQNNDKFNTHPHSHSALPAYQVAHNPWLHCLDLFAAIAVLLLAAFERPAIRALELPVGVHGSVELLCLLLLCVDLGIRFKWVGGKAFLKHKRTMIKGIVIFLMVTESIVVIVRQTNHFRVTRALRPIFLIHTQYCKGVRRIVRQIMQSLPPILDMIVLLLFFMLIFSILGFYLFSGIPKDQNFQSIENSFVSLFVLLTTANYPDVMMPAYAQSSLYSVFFIIYLSLELYFLMNLLLAVVYDTFSNLEKAKVRALYFHKHEGCIHAFRLLVTQSNRSHLTVKHFIGMMEFFVPCKTRREYYLMFKSLNTSESGLLSLEEFFNVYSAAKLQWKLQNDPSLWSSNFAHPLNKIFKALHWFATWKYFDIGIYLVIAGNFLWILIEAIKISSADVSVANYNFNTSWVSVIFVCIYSIEAVIKVLGRGPKDYFTKGWDLFDFLVTVISLVGVFGELFEDSFYYIMVLRPFRLLRLFKIKRRYRDVLGTLFVLFNKLIRPQMTDAPFEPVEHLLQECEGLKEQRARWLLDEPNFDKCLYGMAGQLHRTVGYFRQVLDLTMAIVIIIVFYFYAIIGMEIFLSTDLRNCCKNTSVASYYAYENNTETGFYYLNNFDNLFRSGVTLFELTVVNNWFIIMEGYAIVVSQWTRVYFMSFYISMMVVMNIVVAFVLESFMFRINYRRQMKLDDIEDHTMHKEEVSLSVCEMNMVCDLSQALTGRFIPLAREEESSFVFSGERPQNRDDFSLRMYSDEVKNWSDEFHSNRQEIIETMEKLRNRTRPNSSWEDFQIDPNSARPDGSFSIA